jgi:hypothetical protein
VRIDIGVNKKIDVGRNGISIKIIGIAHSLFIIGNEISNCRLLKIVSSAMVTFDIIGQIRNSKPIIEVLMSQSGENVST